jgi:hypothetical protein
MKFESLSDAELAWLSAQLSRAKAFAGRTDVDGLPSLEALDDVFESFVALGDSANETANEVVLALGVAFGEHLVRTLDFQWCIATDDWGTDIAVVARPGRGNITIYPTDYVSKRWERKEQRFLVGSIGPISKTLAESAAAWGDS